MTLCPDLFENELLQYLQCRELAALRLVDREKRAFVDSHARFGVVRTATIKTRKMLDAPGCKSLRFARARAICDFVNFGEHDLALAILPRFKEAEYPMANEATEMDRFIGYVCEKSTMKRMDDDMMKRLKIARNVTPNWRSGAFNVTLAVFPGLGSSLNTIERLLGPLNDFELAVLAVHACFARDEELVRPILRRLGEPVKKIVLPRNYGHDTFIKLLDASEDP